MSLPVVFLGEAEAEFAEAQAWYEERSPGPGQAFVTSVQAAVERIRRSPLSFPTVDGALRRALVRRFPFGIVSLADSERVVVVAVFHAARDPRAWRTRG